MYKISGKHDLGEGAYVGILDLTGSQNTGSVESIKVDLLTASDIIISDNDDFMNKSHDISLCIIK